MSIRIGMPKVGRFFFAASGLLMSWPPGVFSHATAPHMLPLHSATRTLATPSATLQSPVGSAARADARPDVKNIPEKITWRAMFSGQCNIGSTCAYMDFLREGQNAALGVFS